MMGPVSAFLASITWAIGVSAYSEMSKTYAASTINFTRALIALPCFLIFGFLGVTSEYSGFGFFSHNFSVMNLHNLTWLGTSIVASYAFGDVLLFLSFRILGLPSALAIASSYPIWSALYGALFKSQHLSNLKWLGLFIIVTGTVLVIINGKKNELILDKSINSKKYFLGVLLAIMTSACWSLNTISVSEGGQNLHPFFSNIIRMIYALILCPLFGIWISKTKILLTKKSDIKKYFPIFILEGFGGSFFFMYGLTHAPLSVAAALSSLAPVLSVPIAWIMGWETPKFLRTTGILMVVIGIFLLVGFGIS